MSRVFINENGKTETVTGPPKPMAILLPTLHRERAPGRAKEDKRSLAEPGPSGQGPLCRELRAPTVRGSFWPEKGGEQGGEVAGQVN